MSDDFKDFDEDVKTVMKKNCPNCEVEECHRRNSSNQIQTTKR